MDFYLSFYLYFYRVHLYCILFEQIAKLIELIPNTLRSIKEIGHVYQACIIIEIDVIDKLDNLIRCDKEFKRYYSVKYNQVKKGNHKHALALTARKFVHVVFHLLKNKQLYIPHK